FASRLFLGRPLCRRLCCPALFARRGGPLFGGSFLRLPSLRHDRPPDPLPIRAVATPKPAPDTRCGSSHPTLGRPLFSRLPLQAPSPGSQLPWPDAPAASGEKARL